MTTVAFDGKLLAVDSRVVDDDMLVSDDFLKIFTGTGDIRAAAITGVGQFAGAVERAIHNGGGQFPTGEYSLLAIDDQGLCFDIDLSEEYGAAHRFYYSKPAAMGSGAKFALGAMAAGATAPKAVDIACRYDQSSGGAVRVYEIATGKSSIYTGGTSWIRSIF